MYIDITGESLETEFFIDKFLKCVHPLYKYFKGHCDDIIQLSNIRLKVEFLKCKPFTTDRGSCDGAAQCQQQKGLF